MTLLEQLDTIKKLWAVFTDTPAPTDRTLAIWLSRHSYEDVEKAIALIPGRFTKTPKDERFVHYFVSNTLRVGLSKERAQ
jgi:hypothetical protein